MQPEQPLSPQVAELFAMPRHGGRPGSKQGYRHGAGGSVTGGSLIELWLAQQGGRFVDARFEAFGCPATVACAEWLCRWLSGRDLAAAASLNGMALAEALMLPAAKRTVALVAEDALQRALAAAPEQELDNGSEVDEHGI